MSFDGVSVSEAAVAVRGTDAAARTTIGMKQRQADVCKSATQLFMSLTICPDVSAQVMIRK